MNRRKLRLNVPSRSLRLVVTVATALLGMLAAVPDASAQEIALRVGHFPNITHAQALVARAMKRQGRGWFEERLGPGVTLEWFAYNAGPSAMEALFASSIDLTYVGPSPAINAHAKARGEDIRLVAGAMNGGSALVVQPDAGLGKPSDFRGKKIATPQLGNTQDVAARAWLVAGGLRVTLTGGEAQVLPTANPDQLALFTNKQIDAVWTVEPWVTRLEREAGGRVLIEEPDAVTTVLAASARALREKRDLVRRFVRAHEELTAWVRDNPAQAQEMVRAELATITRSEVSLDLVARAWQRLTPTIDVSRPSVDRFVQDATRVGFLRVAPDLSRLIEVP